MTDKRLVGLGLLGVGMIATGVILLQRKEEIAPAPPVAPMPPIPEPGLASLYGIVTDANTGKLLSGVKVTIAYVFGTTFSDEAGWYSFNNVTPHHYLITFEKAGYDMLTTVVTIVEQTEVNVQMVPVVEGVAIFTMPSVANVEVGVGIYNGVERQTVQFSIPVTNIGNASGVAKVGWELLPDLYENYNGGLVWNIKPGETVTIRTGVVPIYSSYRNIYCRFWGDWAWTGENFEATRGIYVHPILEL